MRFPADTLRSLGIGLLGLAVPLVFVPSAEDAYVLPQLLALSLALACLAGAGFFPKAKFNVGLFELLALAYFLWRLASWCRNNFGTDLQGRMDRDTLYFCLFSWASQNLHDGSCKGKVGTAVVAGMTVACLYGVVQAYGWDPFASHRVDMGFGSRAHATFGNPDFFGGVLILVLPLVMHRFLGSGKQAWLLAIFMGALLLTQTRAAWLGFGAGSALLLIGMRATLKPRTLAVLGAGIGVLLLLFSFPNPANVGRIGLLERANASGLEGRVMMARSGAKVALENPLLGAGTGEAYTKAYLEAQGSLLSRPEFSQEPYRYTSDIHNDWLQIAGEAGGVGLLLFFLLWAGLLGRLWKKRESGEAVVVAAILLSFGVDALFHFPLAVIPSGALIWLFLGWAAAITRGPGNESGNPGLLRGALFLPLTLGLAWSAWISLQASVLLNRGMNLSLNGQEQAGQGPLLRCAQLAPRDARVWMRVGLNADHVGDFKAASEFFGKALKAQPALPEALGNLGLAEAKLGRLEEARRNCQASLALNPRSLETLGNLGKIEYLRGDLSAAQAAYEKGLGVDQNWVQGHFNLAAIFMNTKRPAQAREQLQAVLRLEPGHSEARRLFESLGR